MRYVTSARVRAVGLLLVEVAGLAILVWKRVGKDAPVRNALASILQHARRI